SAPPPRWALSGRWPRRRRTRPGTLRRQSLRCSGLRALPPFSAPYRSFYVSPVLFSSSKAVLESPIPEISGPGVFARTFSPMSRALGPASQTGRRLARDQVIEGGLGGSALGGDHLENRLSVPDLFFDREYSSLR